MWDCVMDLWPGCTGVSAPEPSQIAWPQGALLVQLLSLHPKRCSPRFFLVIVLIVEQLPLGIVIGWVGPSPWSKVK